MRHLAHALLPVALATSLASAPLLAREDPAAPPALPEAARSPRLPNGLFNPMPGGFLAGYAIDTGLDIAGLKQPVFAIASGTLDYAEAGHTRWTGRSDSPFAVRLALDEPIPFRGRKVTHAWYAHLTSVETPQAEGASERVRVEGGQRLGVSGMARGSPHLHLGLLLDGDTSQDWGSYLLEDEVRVVLGRLPNKTRLPAMPARQRR